MNQGRLIAIFALIFGFNAFATANIENDAIPGEYLVKVQKEAFTTDLRQLNLGEQVEVVSKKLNVVLVKRPIVENSNFATQSILDNSAVLYVEPNRIIRINKLPNDPRLDDLWGLNNTGKSGTVGIDIDAEKAWDITTGDRRVVVAVIDTGVDYNIPDLAPNMWTNDAELNGIKGVDDDGNGYVDDIYGYDFANKDGDPMDDHGHGSHCSGTIGAKGNDGLGVVGVNWDVSIMALKFITDSGSGTLDGAIKSIEYAIDMGANILSNSWGSYGESSILKEAVELSNQANTLFVAAAGNESRNNDSSPLYPASYKVANVISVAALNSSGRLAYFSNTGKATVHLAAPGDNILSTIPGGFASWSGTSMATPHVAGVAALILSTDLNLTNAELKRRIIEGVEPMSSNQGQMISNGRLNAFNSLMINN